jgi:deoxyadenosine/deoxycytidine kinase
MGLMTNRDFQNYSSLLNWWNQQLKPWFINLFKKLYPNLVGQIHKRGREYESTISIDYLSRLNER